MAKKTIVVVWCVIIVGFRALMHPQETRMELEGRFLKAANRRMTRFQAKWQEARARLAQRSRRVYEKTGGVYRVFSAHAVLLAYRKRRLILACTLLFFAIPITSAIMTDTLTVYEYSYHGRVLGVVKNVEEVQSAVRLIEGTVVADGDKKAAVSIKAITPEQVPFSVDGSRVADGLGARGSSQDLLSDGGSAKPTRDVAVPLDSNQAIEVKETLLISALSRMIDTEQDVVSNIVSQSDIDVIAYRVAVGGVTLGVVGTREDADALLERIKNYWLGNADTAKFKEIGFAEDVSVEEISSTLLAVEHADDLYARAFEDLLNPKTYTVGTGETILNVAMSNGVTEQQISAWNPAIDPDALVPGETLIMEEPRAKLNVRTVEEGYYTTSIHFETIYEETDTLFDGEEKVVEPGVPGVKNAYGGIVRVDGEIVEYLEQSSVVVAEAKPQIVKKGTKPIPPSIGTGTFIVPIEGLVTSLYGPRWGRIHEGIDFGAPVGTTVRAADGGTVTAVGWDGNFGMTVMIDHGAGFSTLYAHLSQTFVQEGDDVYQGQQIAESGNTGFSTGPHLHFGIYKFGESQSPSDYLPADMPMYLLSGVRLD